MSDLVNVPNFLSRAANQIGFVRERYNESRVPQDFGKIVVMPFFGDLRYLSILSSFLLNPLVKNKGKYFILCSWQGCANLFPYVDEYWSISDIISMKEMVDNARCFGNTSIKYDSYIRNLVRYFENIMTWEDDISPYYKNGFTSMFFEKFGDDVERFLPSIQSPKLEFAKDLASRSGKKLFIHPIRMMTYWNRRDRFAPLRKDFWVELVNKLLVNKYQPIVYQNYATYDISDKFGDKCIYVTDTNMSSVMAAMRASGCVLDLFNGISRIAMLARCPFVVCDERLRYVNSKEYELNDLCASNLQHKYILHFCTLLNEERGYKDMIENIISVTDKFNLGQLPSSAESYTKIPYSVVRQHKAKKLGCKFIRVERIEI